jgi:ditrans,polycis-polyprenyl diphosphate synthase
MDISGSTRRLASKILSVGPIPRHVAFIMDGNRRWADAHGYDRHTGHSVGYEKMKQVLQWCMDIGCKVCTVFAFSIENFHRSPHEVSARDVVAPPRCDALAQVKFLMDLAVQKFNDLISDNEIVMKLNVKVNVLGDLSLLRDDVRASALKAMHVTRHNSACTLNICFSYTSSWEVGRAMHVIHAAVDSGKLRAADISADLFSECLQTSRAPPVDLLIRSSGEQRLSDFLLWQADSAMLCFVPVMWPDFSLFRMLACILRYQANVLTGRVRPRSHSDFQLSSASKRAKAFVRSLQDS